MNFAFIFFLGRKVVGWVVALVWAVKGDDFPARVRYRNRTVVSQTQVQPLRVNSVNLVSGDARIGRRAPRIFRDCYRPLLPSQ